MKSVKWPLRHHEWPRWRRRSLRFAAVLVDYNLRLDAEGVKAGAQKIHFRFDGGEIVLCAPLQNEACASAARLGTLATYKKTFLGSTVAKPARISSARQPWRWKLTMSDCRNTAQP